MMAARPSPDAGQLVEGDAETVGELEGVSLALTGEVALLVGVLFGGSTVDWEPQAKRRSVKEQHKSENKKNFARMIGMAILREKRDVFIPGSTVDNYSTGRHFNEFFYKVYEKEGINFPGKLRRRSVQYFTLCCYARTIVIPVSLSGTKDAPTTPQTLTRPCGGHIIRVSKSEYVSRD
jgi:hypothetical protein